MTYALPLAHGRKQADLIASKAKETLDALFVEYSMIKDGNILKLTPNVQFVLKVRVKKNVGMDCLKG